MGWKKQTFTNQAHAQALVKRLIKAGYESGEDIRTSQSNGTYTVEYNERGFGIFGS